LSPSLNPELNIDHSSTANDLALATQPHAKDPDWTYDSFIAPIAACPGSDGMCGNAWSDSLQPARTHSEGNAYLCIAGDQA
jgi:hypothetical protein